MSAFLKEVDELLDQILSDYVNQFPAIDISQGSLVYIRSACLASALWGLYRFQDWIAAQIFPDTADATNMEHHAWVRGLTRRVGESDAELLARLLEYIRRPPAGGNKYDYVKWALTIDNVKAAYCIPLAQGLGTVDVILIADDAATGSEIPSTHTGVEGVNTSVVENKLVDSSATFITAGVAPGDTVDNIGADLEASVSSVDSETELTLSDDIFTETGQAYEITSLAGQVKAYIDDVRPVTAKTVRVLSPEMIVQDVTMTVSGDNLSLTTIAADIEAYMKGLIPGETLAVTQMVAIAINNGADDVTVITPDANVTADDDELIRPGTIDVSEI